MAAPKRPQDHLPPKSTRAQAQAQALSALSPDVAAWLLGIVGGLTLNAGAPDFDEAYVMVSKARAQLQAIAGPLS